MTFAYNFTENGAQSHTTSNAWTRHVSTPRQLDTSSVLFILVSLERLFLQLHCPLLIPSASCLWLPRSVWCLHFANLQLASVHLNQARCAAAVGFEPYAQMALELLCRKKSRNNTCSSLELNTQRHRKLASKVNARVTETDPVGI